MQSRTLWIGAITSLLLVAGNIAFAASQQLDKKSEALPSDLRPEVLGSIKTQLQKNYFNTPLLSKIIDRLTEGERSGRYATVDPSKFAALITEDMQNVTTDTHLYLSFHPEWYSSEIQPEDPKEAKERHQYEHQVARNTNFGITESKVLVGNVRYLKIDGFSWIDGEGVEAYDAAMAFLQGGKAIIIDLRSNRGGDTIPAYYLLSHLMESDELMYTWHSTGKPDIQLRASPYLRRRLTNIPLYVLVNSQSRSAAEAIAYDVRQFKLGEVIGEQTEGAANPSDDFLVAPYFRLSIPVMYPEDPVSHSNWEGVGVKPTILATSSKALDVAYGMAIDKLLTRDPNREEQLFLNWAKDGLTAKSILFNPSMDELLSLTGTYGDYRVQLIKGSLWLHRADQKSAELKIVGDHGLFEAKENFMLRARLHNNELVILHLGSKPVTIKRTSLSPKA